MTYRLFIDDERQPPEDGKHWHIVRTSSEAIQMIQQKGIPEYISFDHDLGGKDTSMVFLNWLVTHCLDNSLAFTFAFYIHSQNPIGKKNIEGLIASYRDYYKNAIQT